MPLRSVKWQNKACAVARPSQTFGQGLQRSGQEGPGECPLRKRVGDEDADDQGRREPAVSSQTGDETVVADNGLIDGIELSEETESRESPYHEVEERRSRAWSSGSACKDGTDTLTAFEWGT